MKKATDLNLATVNHLWEYKNSFSILGVCSSKSVWYWYYLIDGDLFFVQSYSQINGQTKTRANAIARRSAENLLNKYCENRMNPEECAGTCPNS